MAVVHRTRARGEREAREAVAVVEAAAVVVVVAAGAAVRLTAV